MTRSGTHSAWTISAGFLGLLLAGPATATTFTATQLGYDNAILSQFNLVNLNGFTTTNETEGRIVVGGNATVGSSGSATTNVCFNGCAGGNVAASVDGTGQKYGALTVFGNLAGGYSVMNGGDLNVGGTASGTYNLNGKGAFNVGGTVTSSTVVQAPTAVRTMQPGFAGMLQNANGVTAQTSVTAAFPFASFGNTFANPLLALAQGIAALPGSPGVTAQALPTGNNTFITANNDYTANGKSYGVITTTLANLASEQNFGGINNNGNAATLVIVTGDGANYLLPNMNSYANSSRVIFDFVNATTLKFGGAFYGAVLAPLATITQQSGVLDGSVVVAAINQTNELHQDGLFNGDLTGLAGFTYGPVAAVPEPASLLLLIVGLVATRRLNRPD